MCSDQKRQANRVNALKSTGPKTAKGKAVSSRNATKHGLTAQSAVVLEEDPQEFEEFAEAIRQDSHRRVQGTAEEDAERTGATGDGSSCIDTSCEDAKQSQRRFDD